MRVCGYRRNPLADDWRVLRSRCATPSPRIKPTAVQLARNYMKPLSARRLHWSDVATSENAYFANSFGALRIWSKTAWVLSWVLFELVVSRAVDLFVGVDRVRYDSDEPAFEPSRHGEERTRDDPCGGWRSHEALAVPR